MPAIVVNCRSSGLAIAEDTVEGSPPGRLALMLIVGKSTLGRLLTGRPRYAIAPNSAIATMMRLVATGRWMNHSEKFTSHHCVQTTSHTPFGRRCRTSIRRIWRQDLIAGEPG